MSFMDGHNQPHDPRPWRTEHGGAARLVVAEADHTRLRGPAEVPSHHRTVGLVPGNDLEAVPGEGGRDPGKQVAGMPWHRRVYRASLQRGGASRGCRLDSGFDQRCHHSTATVGRPHEKAGKRPHRQVIWRRHVPGTRQPSQFRARGQRAPSDRPGHCRRPAGPAAARRRRAGGGRACSRCGAGQGSGGRSASTGTSTRSRRQPCRTGLPARASGRPSAG